MTHGQILETLRRHHAGRPLQDMNFPGCLARGELESRWQAVEGAEYVYKEASILPRQAFGA